MPRLLRTWPFLFWIGSICPPAFAASPLTLHLLTENDPPLSFEQNGIAAGEITETLQQAFEKQKLPFHAEVWSWPRAYEAAKTKAGFCVYGTARTPEREHQFKWIGPVSEMEWVIYAKKGTTHPASIQMLKAESIGGYKDDAISDWLDNHGYQVDLASDDSQNPAKLMIGRFSFWATSKSRGEAIVAAQHLQSRLEPILSFGKSGLYLACHKSLPDNVAQSLNQTLLELVKNGHRKKLALVK